MKRRAPDAPVRVLLVEATRARRHDLAALIEGAAELSLAEAAANGAEAVNAALRLQPDVIAMNIDLPGPDGLAVAREIMQRCPAPIVLLAQAVNPGLSEQATAAGAMALVEQPGSPTSPAYAAVCASLVKTLRLMADVPVVTRFAPLRVSAARAGTAGQGRREILAIAASTGGPGAIRQILGQLGADFPLPIVLVQHIAHDFIGSLAAWLASVTLVAVEVVQAEKRLRPGTVYLAPGNHHLIVPRRGWVAASPADPAEDPYCPSANVLFHSVARSYRDQAIGVILTGMGDDGAGGLLAMREAGALTLAQDEASSIVYGMPQAAVRANAVQQSGSLDDLPALIVKHSARR